MLLRYRYGTLPQLRRYLTILAAILDPTVIAKILAHLALTFPRTAARTRADSRSSKPPDRQPIPHSTRFSSLSRQPPSARVRARRQTAPKIDVSDGGRARKSPNSRQ